MRHRGPAHRRMTQVFKDNRETQTVRLKTSIIALALLALVACGSGNGAETKVPDDQAIKPNAGESAWKTTSVDGVEITLPGELEKVGPVSPGADAVMFTFQAPENSFGTRGGVQVVTLPKLKKPAAELADTVVAQARATTGAKRTSKKRIIWPGAKDAWLVTYVAQVPKNGKTAPHPAEVLILDLPGGGQSQATVTALEEDFAPLKMHEILGTLKVTKVVSAKKS